MVNIQNLIDDIKCFETVRQLRWPQGVTCPHCDSPRITKQGHDTTQPERQRYQCQACHKLFDDLTGTIFAGHHQPLRVWILCLYFMGLNRHSSPIPTTRSTRNFSITPGKPQWQLVEFGHVPTAARHPRI